MSHSVIRHCYASMGRSECVTSTYMHCRRLPLSCSRWCIPHWAFASSAATSVRRLFVNRCRYGQYRHVAFEPHALAVKQCSCSSQKRMRIKQTYITGDCRELWARPGRSCVDVACENGDQRGLQAPASTGYQCKKVYLGQTERLLGS